ncbi:MAG: PLP-dependent aminotransferase family protein [Desulfobacula sp.]|jgi:DNA-binding transcriptional MocR family regulator|uniref:aminotransferase class I/II-fold pyridoxal phosphate-dependent enzyme n=2 Tax=Desulfobacula sp. TaxID=2593537 RepID=UPI001D1C6F95|nr:PLP-dependent aminotransferase family protein [Desulfobacula sp.]MBT3806494.1 PLP-dependent aminotransferase family protein [Desulfobacula sp.]MBT4027349.1 PLP-dependent aminotransferase family protein [Desulfobacula sp.]MBT4200820.1 PLP-dependent aminotransferase family protein [Desulfobacula sp.]MBT4508305.1 PLP-dependent aminotransferase family protein [Desulfobacula sp.]
MGESNYKKSINFLRGVPAEEALSKLIPMASKGYKKAITNYGTDVLQYGHFNGFKPLKDLIGTMHHVDPERIIVGNGGMEVISLLFKSLPKQSNIIVEEMTYDRVIHDAQRYGHNLIGVELTQTGLNIDQLKEVIRKTSFSAFYGIPFHQNPTGIDYTPENRNAVESICKANNIFCIWDICYEPLRYDGKHNEPIAVSEWGPILVSSFTKTISPGTKCGYMVLPEKIIKEMTKIVANTRLNPNLPTQGFIVDFIQSGEYNDYLNYLCTLYKPRMDALNTSLNTNFPGAFPVVIKGGFFSCITLEAIPFEKEEIFQTSALEAGVGVAPAWDAVAPNLREEKQKKGLCVRLTFPAYDAQEIQWGIAKLKQVEELMR